MRTDDKARQDRCDLILLILKLEETLNGKMVLSELIGDTVLIDRGTMDGLLSKIKESVNEIINELPQYRHAHSNAATAVRRLQRYLNEGVFPGDEEVKDLTKY